MPVVISKAGRLIGRLVIGLIQTSLIGKRGFVPAANAGIHFTDVTSESGLPDFGGGPAPTALALGDYDGDGEDNLLIAWPPANVRLYTLRKGFVVDAGDRITLPLPAGAVSATFADYAHDGWLDLLVAGPQGRRLFPHDRGKRLEDASAGPAPGGEDDPGRKGV